MCYITSSISKLIKIYVNQVISRPLFINFLKGEGGILLFSYKVVDFFVDIIYESTLGGYEKVLGISRPEKKKFEF